MFNAFHTWQEPLAFEYDDAAQSNHCKIPDLAIQQGKGRTRLKRETVISVPSIFFFPMTEKPIHNKDTGKNVGKMVELRFSLMPLLL